MAKRVGSRLVMHLLNYVNASTLEWRDNLGTQRIPVEVENISFTFTSEDTALALWSASPDYMQGSPDALSFTQQGKSVSFTLPNLKYWRMIVVEYESGDSSSQSNANSCNGFFTLYDVYPNPARQAAIIRYSLHEAAKHSITIYNILGQKIKTLIHTYKAAGDYDVIFSPEVLSDGIYFYTIQTPKCSQTKKMLLIK